MSVGKQVKVSGSDPFAALSLSGHQNFSPQEPASCIHAPWVAVTNDLFFFFAMKLAFTFGLPLFCAIAAAVPIKTSLVSRQASQILDLGDGPSQALDGTPILEQEVTIGGLPMRFKISAPQSSLVNGANKAKRQTGQTLGLNVLLHVSSAFRSFG